MLLKHVLAHFSFLHSSVVTYFITAFQPNCFRLGFPSESVPISTSSKVSELFSTFLNSYRKTTICIMCVLNSFKAISVYRFIYLFLCIYVFISIYLLSLYLCLFVYVFIYLLIYLSVWLSIYLFIHHSIYPSIYVFIFFIYLSVDLSISHRLGSSQPTW